MLTITKIKGVKLPPVERGYRRQWNICTRCGQVCYRDFVPYSLSNPIIIMPCGHDAVDTSVRKSISPNEAVSRITDFMRGNSSC